MKIPLQINFHDMPVSPALETLIREKAAKLEQFHPNLTGCRVVVDKPHQHSRQQGDQFSVTVDVSVPGATIVANNASSEDPNVAVRDAFLAARRQVEDHVKRQRTEERQAAARSPALQLDGTALAVAGLAGAGSSLASDTSESALEADEPELDGVDLDELIAGGSDRAAVNDDEIAATLDAEVPSLPLPRPAVGGAGAPGL
jgi:ribosomal subunit interface protein